VQEKNILN